MVPILGQVLDLLVLFFIIASGGHVILFHFFSGLVFVIFCAILDIFTTICSVYQRSRHIDLVLIVNLGKQWPWLRC